MMSNGHLVQAGVSSASVAFEDLWLRGDSRRMTTVAGIGAGSSSSGMLPVVACRYNPAAMPV